MNVFCITVRYWSEVRFYATSDMVEGRVEALRRQFEGTTASIRVEPIWIEGYGNLAE